MISWHKFLGILLQICSVVCSSDLQDRSGKERADEVLDKQTQNPKPLKGPRNFSTTLKDSSDRSRHAESLMHDLQDAEQRSTAQHFAVNSSFFRTTDVSASLQHARRMQSVSYTTGVVQVTIASLTKLCAYNCCSSSTTQQPNCEHGPLCIHHVCVHVPQVSHYVNEDSSSIFTIRQTPFLI